MSQSTNMLQWSIIFSGSSPKYRDQAHYIQGAPDKQAFQSAKSEILVDFIDKLNASFKQAAEMMLSKGPNTPEQKRQVEEIQEQFNIVDQWIAKMRKHFPKSP